MSRDLMGNLLTSTRLLSLRSKIDRALGFYARAQELGHFATNQPPRPTTLGVLERGSCLGCDKSTQVAVDMTLSMVEDFLDELERQCESMTKISEKRALAALEKATQKRVKGNRR